jgi:hypothetical protein
MANADVNAEVLAVKEFANTESGTLTNSEAGNVLCDARIKVYFNGTAYYIPLYDTAP